MIDAPAAWADVLVTHRAELVRTARARLHGQVDAEDVVHEVVLRLLRNGRPAKEVGAPMAYLRRAVLNECASRWRRTSRDVLMETVPDQPTDSAAEGCLDRLVLHGALAGLTERQRRVITLSLLDDRADAEIAAALGVTDVTIRTTRRRALARLRLLLADSAPARVPVGHRRDPLPYPGPGGPAEPGGPSAPTAHDAAERPATKPASWSTAA
jgi:RNA polymerase sigma factor (sigma-70 family)